jgi:hypothetical protein
VARLRDMPLRTQLMVQFAFLSIFTTAVSTVTLTTLHAQRMHAELEERAHRMARRLQTPLEAAARTGENLGLGTRWADWSAQLDLLDAQGSAA